MGFLSTLAYVILSFILGGSLIFISLNYLNTVYLEKAFMFIYSDPRIRVIVGLLGLWIIIRCISTIQRSIIRNQREKTIAFEGNLGEVSVSLSAVEEMTRKLLLEFKELRDVRPHVTASKKGLLVTLRIVLSSYTNIPEFTNKIQTLVKDKLQNMLGIEEDINIKVEIKKILYNEPKPKRPEKEKEQEPDQEKPFIPYRDYNY